MGLVRERGGVGEGGGARWRRGMTDVGVEVVREMRVMRGP